MWKGQQTKDNILGQWQIFSNTQDFQRQHVTAVSRTFSNATIYKMSKKFLL